MRPPAHAGSRREDTLRSLRRMNDAAKAATPVRLCFGAAHVVLHESYRALGHRLDAPADAAEIRAHVDWDATMRIRRWLDDNGFGIAEAMDTAQRFFLGWDSARELIARTSALRLTHGFCAGAGTDHLREVHNLDELADCFRKKWLYLFQVCISKSIYAKNSIALCDR